MRSNPAVVEDGSLERLIKSSKGGRRRLEGRLCRHIYDNDLSDVFVVDSFERSHYALGT